MKDASTENNQVNSHKTTSDVETVSCEKVYKGYFSVDKYVFRFRRFNGEMSAPISREIFERGDAAAVIPYDPVRNEVILIQQFRPGAAVRDKNTCWLNEIVAGIIDKGENPETTVRRECMEEAGIKLGKVMHAFDFYTTPGGSSEKISLFVGEADSSVASGIHGLKTEGEDIRVFKVSFAKAMEMLEQGMFINSIAIAGLQYLALHIDYIKKNLCNMR